MRHPEALTIVARCANPTDPDTMLDALRLLAAVCLVKDGCVAYLSSLLLSSFL